MADKFLNTTGLQYFWEKLKTKINVKLSFDSSGRKATFTNDKNETIDIQNINNDKSSIYILSNGLQTTNYIPTEQAMNNAIDGLQAELGDLSTLTTDDKTSLVKAINEVYEKSGEPFRVKQWAGSWAAGVTIPVCTKDISNTSIAKMTFSIDAEEGAAYQIVGMIAYEVFDNVSGGNRLNVWPVCQFTGNGQKELSVRWTCMGATDKIAKRINAWVLLKHR